MKRPLKYPYGVATVYAVLAIFVLNVMLLMAPLIPSPTPVHAFVLVCHVWMATVVVRC